jgi:hypothetical protein
VCLCPLPNFFLFCAVLVLSKEGVRLIVPKTYCSVAMKVNIVISVLN